MSGTECSAGGRVSKKLAGLKDKDFKVKLGSILESEVRDYYSANRFSYLVEKLRAERAKQGEF